MNDEFKIRDTWFQEYKLVISAFLAGTGIIIWLYNIFMSPIKSLEVQFIKLQAQVDIIQNNELVHLKDNILALTASQLKQQEKIDSINEGVIKLLQLHGVK